MLRNPFPSTSDRQWRERESSTLGRRGDRSQGREEATTPSEREEEEEEEEKRKQKSHRRAVEGERKAIAVLNPYPLLRLSPSIAIDRRLNPRNHRTVYIHPNYFSSNLSSVYNTNFYIHMLRLRDSVLVILIVLNFLPILSSRCQFSRSQPEIVPGLYLLVMEQALQLILTN